MSPRFRLLEVMTRSLPTYVQLWQLLRITRQMHKQVQSTYLLRRAQLQNQKKYKSDGLRLHLRLRDRQVPQHQSCLSREQRRPLHQFSRRVHP